MLNTTANAIIAIFAAVFAITVVTAAPQLVGESKRQFAPPLATCQFVVVPNQPVSPATVDFHGEFDIVFDFYFLDISPNSTAPASPSWQTTVSWTNDAAFTLFNVMYTTGIDGWTAAQTASALRGIVGMDRGGFAAPSNLGLVKWHFNSGVCSP
ncbi:hypothetical protein D9619_011006 [Psilocybe cf. subviscida]|uniref:ML-like domain-containing protein n=1 Tax=Psilocybe cf. subviscida TaxID=2480587 RepID=A0A8H5EZU2_9AGAR|nr:hypothetical protein D9619_011006 [Psilocybe cf. subviscida]